MSSSRPISTPRALWILARLSLRRQLNRWQSIRFARKRQARFRPSGEQGQRSATPAKNGGPPVFGIFLFLMLGFDGFLLGGRGLVLLSSTAQNLNDSTVDKIVVTLSTHARLEQADDALHRVRQMPNSAEREKYLGMWNRYLDGIFLNEVRRGAYSDEEESARLQHMREVFAQQGAAGFAHPQRGFWISTSTWPRAAASRSVFLVALSFTLMLWMPLIVFGSLGTNNKDLGQVEWSFEWLSTFPISPRALFASRLLVYGVLHPLVWVFLFPFLLLVYVAAGAGLAALPLALAAMIYLVLLAGALTTILEVAMRKFLTLSRLKSFQALFTVLGTASLLLFYASSNSTLIDNLLVRGARLLPAWIVWNPLSLPLMAASCGGRVPCLLPGKVLGLMALTLVLGCALALAGSEWLTRDGLVKAGGPYQGARVAPAKSSPRLWLRGIPAHEMLLLSRDRNLLVQVLIVPLMVPAYYLLINTNMVSAVSGNFRHAAMLAFAVGAYSFLNSAIPVLSREDRTLWYLMSFPRSLSSILAKKAAVWAALGMAYGALTLGVITHFSHHLHGRAWTDVLVALYGIGLYAFIGSGIGILGTNLQETVRPARFRTDMIYLYMVLAAVYANAIYSPSAWAKIAQIVLSTLLAVALWQKVKDFTPYVLDPVERPPRQIGLADGMIAALAFFAMQGLIFLFLRAVSRASFASQITIAYVLAGIVIGGAAMVILSMQGITDIWGAVGLVAGRAEPLFSRVRRSILVGTICGLGASIGAFAYLRALDLSPQWQLWKQDAALSSFFTRADKPGWLILLTIIAAPVFEEFIFRGLVFGGLRRTTGPAVAVLGSAALFALVHPPIAIIPVFGLGVAAAISFERTGFLLAPIIAHCVYNTSVMFLNKL
ncbi:MAG: type II CAAX endopeptidase family protein [Terriglobales bacterium]|jgi:ABC-2 type transport system permease protein